MRGKNRVAEFPLRSRRRTPPRAPAMPKIKLPRKIRDLAKKASGGCAESALRLYQRYLEGTGGAEKNYELARQWLTRAAELGGR